MKRTRFWFPLSTVGGTRENVTKTFIDHLYSPKWYKHIKERETNTVITKITLTISNGEHIKQTLRTNKPYRHQQQLQQISQNVSGVVRMAIRCGRNTCTVRQLLCYRAFKQFH